MNETVIKTRLGYVLQNLIAEVLSRSGYTYVMDPQYDPTCEVPDFLIPDDQYPKYLVEVHQTEARNSFQMKTLRAFTAVVEGKSHYGNDLISVNVLFGDPYKELPPANVRAMCSFFDANIIPRQHLEELADVMALEGAALAAASTDGKTIAASSKEIIADYSGEIDSLAKIVDLALKSASARSDMTPLWGMERKRTKALGKSPMPGANTYYKRMLLRSLYLKDKDFQELVAKKDPALCSQSTLEQLIATDLVEVQEDIDGDTYVLALEFRRFVEDPEAPGLSALCKARLDAEPAMHWYFEDIRDKERRTLEAELFVSLYEAGQLERSLEENILSDTFQGIEHGRTWLVDLLAKSANISLNHLSRQIYTSGSNKGMFGDPISHICPKTARLRSLPEGIRRSYAKDIVRAFGQVCSELKIGSPCLDVNVLQERLLKLRLDGAIKLRRLDPLFIVSAKECEDLGLTQGKVSIRSIVGDLANSTAAGRYEAYEIADGKKKAVMMNAVAVHDNHGDDKSKEWGARRLATIYRMKNGKFGFGDYDNALFILDGEWAQKDVQRLYRDGWNHICRLGDLKDKLKEIFEL